MAQEIAFLELEDSGVEEVDVGTAYCCACNADDNVLWIDDGWLRDLDWRLLVPAQKAAGRQEIGKDYVLPQIGKALVSYG